MLFSPICPFLEEFPPPSLANALFQRYRFLKVLSDVDCWNQSLPFVITSVNTEDLSLMVENSNLRR